MSSDGYLASFVGSLAGGVPLGAGAYGALAQITCDANQGFECLGVFIVAVGGAALAAVLGAAVGCWLALRRRHHAAAGTTAAVLVSSVVVTALALLALPAVLPAAPAIVLVLPLVARRVALRLVRSHPVEI